MVEMLCTDMLVTNEYLLRKNDAATNFARMYELVEEIYCEDKGRPSCNPVIPFKIVLLQHLFGIRSLRQTMREAEVNDMSMVFVVRHVAAFAALCNNQLRIPASIHS